jgi:hypothetical protein
VEALWFHAALQGRQRDAAGNAWQEHGLVFASTVGTERNPNNVLRSFRVILRKNTELRPEDWTPREMRHSFVSVLSDSGVPLEALSVRPSCNVSRTANSAPSTSAPDAEKACVSNHQQPKTSCSDHDNHGKEQYVDASKQSEMSPSMNQVVPDHLLATSVKAVWQPRRGRKPCERPENCGS